MRWRPGSATRRLIRRTSTLSSATTTALRLVHPQRCVRGPDLRICRSAAGRLESERSDACDFLARDGQRRRRWLRRLCHLILPSARVFLLLLLAARPGHGPSSTAALLIAQSVLRIVHLQLALLAAQFARPTTLHQRHLVLAHDSDHDVAQFASRSVRQALTGTIAAATLAASATASIARQGASDAGRLGRSVRQERRRRTRSVRGPVVG